MQLLAQHSTSKHHEKPEEYDGSEVSGDKVAWLRIGASTMAFSGLLTNSEIVVAALKNSGNADSSCMAKSSFRPSALQPITHSLKLVESPC